MKQFNVSAGLKLRYNGYVTAKTEKEACEMANIVTSELQDWLEGKEVYFYHDDGLLNGEIHSARDFDTSVECVDEDYKEDN
jgi:hypothetical protein